ncbi:AAA family ATPase [Corynebacterium xerosis]|uniref:AAA family ATPase n=1 Tax=Corynebacterium xerosis TaxID=1725 RepID=UPI00366FCA4C
MLTHELTTDNARAEALADVLRDAPRVDQTSRAAVLAWAARLQARGVHLFAVARRGKEPATPGGFRDATTDPEVLDGQYAAGMNLGAWLGPSGLIVIDADTSAEVAEFRKMWEAGWFGSGPFPDPTVTTPGTGDGHANGGHWWFAAAAAEHTAEMPSPAIGFKRNKGNATGMTGNRYVLVPGSVRDDVADPTTPDYRTTGTVAPAPASLVDMVAREESAQKHRAAEAAERRAAFQDRRAAGDAGDFETSVEDWGAGTSWAELLEPHGWSLASSVASCGCENWTRPGKAGGAKSATAHVACETVDGSTVLRVFSDHAEPLKAKAHNKLQTYAALEHGGDMAAAVAELGLATSVEGHNPVMLSAEDVRATVVSPATEAGWAETVAKVEARAAARAEEAGPEVPAGLSEGVARHVQDMLDREEAARVVKRMHAERTGTARRRVESLNLEDLFNDEPPAQRWTVDGLWSAEGQTLLYAPAKVGKSRLAHNVVEALTSGDRFLGLFDTPRVDGRVGLIDLELNKWTLRERLAGMEGLDPARVQVWPLAANPAQFDLTDPEMLAGLAAELRAANITVLVVDPLSALIRATGMDEWREGGRALQLLRQLCADAGVRSHLVVDHASSKRDGMAQGPRGDSAKLDVPDHVWKFYPAESNEAQPSPADRFHLETTGRALPVSVELRLEGQRFLATDAPNPAARARTDAYRIWTMLREVLSGLRADLWDGQTREPDTDWPTRTALQKAAMPVIGDKTGLSRRRYQDAVERLIVDGVLAEVAKSSSTTVIHPTGVEPVAVPTAFPGPQNRG